jgi:hypothetical protein
MKNRKKARIPKVFASGMKNYFVTKYGTFIDYHNYVTGNWIIKQFRNILRQKARRMCFGGPFTLLLFLFILYIFEYLEIS